MVLDQNVQREQSLINLIKTKKKPTLSAEIIPPRNGSEISQIVAQIETLKKIPVDFLSVTKGAGGSLRGGTLPIAQLVRNRFETPALAHFTCRDYTIEEIENQLVDHSYSGVTNILALRGDPPDGQPDYFKPSQNRHTFAWQLVEQIANLNEGRYIARKGFDSDATKVRKGERTQFCIGVAAHPEHEPFSEAIDFFELKVKKGAQFAITQMIFQTEPYERFLNACEKRNCLIPTLPGIRVITQASTAERMIKKFGCKIPSSFLEKLSKASTPEDAKKIGLEYSLNLSQNFLKAGAPGIHVFVMSDAQTGAELLKNFL
jgi:methylenetetrahydrofolate reductase (NADPH)